MSLPLTLDTDAPGNASAPGLLWGRRVRAHRAVAGKCAALTNWLRESDPLHRMKLETARMEIFHLAHGSFVSGDVWIPRPYCGRSALSVRADPHRVIAADLSHSYGEQRYYCFGRVGGGVMTVRFTYREDVIRIFGAGRTG